MRVEFDIPDGLIDPALADHALAVGALCNAWAHLENQISFLFLNVVNSDCTPKLQVAIANALDVRDMLKAVKLAVVDSDLNSHERAICIQAIDYIDTELRPWRNRFVHDRWHHFLDDGDIARWNETPVIKRQPTEIFPFTIAYEGVEAVHALTGDVAMYAGFIGKIGRALRGDEVDRTELILGQPPQPSVRR